MEVAVGGGEGLERDKTAAAIAMRDENEERDNKEQRDNNVRQARRRNESNTKTGENKNKKTDEQATSEIKKKPGKIDKTEVKHDANTIRIEVKGPNDEIDDNENVFDDDDVIQSAEAVFKTGHPNIEYSRLFVLVPSLEKQSNQFFQFVQTVHEDISEKIKALSEYKAVDCNTKRKDRGYMKVQMLMLRTYLRRIASFKAAATRSLNNLQAKSDSDNLSNLVEQHAALINKLKTILKHILDVSERYAANDLFNELCHAVKAEQICQGQDNPVLSRQSKSLELLTDFDKCVSTSSLPNPTRPPPSPNQPRCSTPNILQNLPQQQPTPDTRNQRMGLQKYSMKLLFPSSPSVSPSTSPTPSPASSPDSTSSLGEGREEWGGRKRASSIQSITRHLAVLRKTYSTNR